MSTPKEIAVEALEQAREHIRDRSWGYAEEAIKRASELLALARIEAVEG